MNIRITDGGAGAARTGPGGHAVTRRFRRRIVRVSARPVAARPHQRVVVEMTNPVSGIKQAFSIMSGSSVMVNLTGYVPGWNVHQPVIVPVAVEARVT